MAPATTNWQAIAEQASIEMDSEKLMALVARLCSVMDADDEKKQGKPSPLLNPINV